MCDYFNYMWIYIHVNISEFRLVFLVKYIEETVEKIQNNSRQTLSTNFLLNWYEYLQKNPYKILSKIYLWFPFQHFYPESPLIFFFRFIWQDDKVLNYILRFYCTIRFIFFFFAIRYRSVFHHKSSQKFLQKI